MKMMEIEKMETKERKSSLNFDPIVQLMDSEDALAIEPGGFYFAEKTADHGRWYSFREKFQVPSETGTLLA